MRNSFSYDYFDSVFVCSLSEPFFSTFSQTFAFTPSEVLFKPLKPPTMVWALRHNQYRGNIQQLRFWILLIEQTLVLLIIRVWSQHLTKVDAVIEARFLWKSNADSSSHVHMWVEKNRLEGKQWLWVVIALLFSASVARLFSYMVLTCRRCLPIHHS